MNQANQNLSAPVPSEAAPDRPGSPPPQPGHVNLRLSYLVTGNPRPPHSFGNVTLDTTISTLRDRIQTELPEHPSPAEQRLIYQGRPLLRNDATLRDVLRIEAGREASPFPYTIHIVIQTQQPPQSSLPPSNPALNPPSAGRPPSDLTNPLRAAETSANRLQESLARIQHQIEANRADLRSVQHRIAMQHTHLGTPPVGQPPHFGVPQLDALGQHMQMPFSMNVNLGPPFDQWPQPAHPTGMQPRRPLSAQPGTTNPSHVSSARQPSRPEQNIANMSNPNVQEFQGPNGERVTVVSDQMTFQIPLPRSSSAPGHRVAATSSTASPQTSQPPQAAEPFFPIAPSHPPIPQNHVHWPIQPPTVPAPRPPVIASEVTSIPRPPEISAWVLSSPTRPQAILFAPGHGYFFFSPPEPEGQSTTVPTPSAQPAQSSVSDRTAGSQPGPPNGPDHQDDGRAVVRAEQRPAAPALEQAQQNGGDNDLFAFMIQRGWLFLRLYLFMFVFSEPGTWKRWLMIIVAAIVCLQPRDGPLTRALTIARRHLDNLIGPPAPQPRAEPGARGQGVGEGQLGPGNPRSDRVSQRPANVRGAVQMTPQEAAARLAREQRERNPQFWRDTFYRIEQSTALFLASLIPGVGERHVRAREEARREEQRIEEERRRAAEETAARAQDVQVPSVELSNDSSGVSTEEAKYDQPAEQGMSTSVQVTETVSESEDLRNRQA